MNIFTLIFGDRHAEKIGRALLEYFESDGFPKELLQYPELNVLYRDHKLKVAERGRGSADMETIEYLEALLALHRSKLDAESEESGQ